MQFIEDIQVFDFYLIDYYYNCHFFIKQYNKGAFNISQPRNV